jgi:hypothetical protein
LEIKILTWCGLIVGEDGDAYFSPERKGSGFDEPAFGPVEYVNEMGGSLPEYGVRETYFAIIKNFDGDTPSR